jgi:phage shock protein A
MTKKAEKLAEEVLAQKKAFDDLIKTKDKTFDDLIKTKDKEIAAKIKLCETSHDKVGKLETQKDKLTNDKKNLQSQIAELKKLTKPGNLRKNEESSEG